MYVAKSTEYQNPLCIVNVLEDIAGGGVVKRAGLKSTDSIKQGTVLCKNAAGLYEVYKSAKANAAVTGTPTAYPVKKGHEFIVGDIVMIQGKTTSSAISTPITSIDTSNADYDTINVGTTIGALAATDYLVLSTATAASSATEAQTPSGIALDEVNLSVANQSTGIMVRGTVNESILPYLYPTKVKTTLNLIRFI